MKYTKFMSVRKLILMSVMIPTLGFAQSITVKGIVKDDTGFPLPGVNVIEDGTRNGTITDIDGKYTLEITEKGRLLFTYIGCQDMTVPVNGKNQINVTLKESQQSLDEVVVVGYGTAKKSDVTGSIANFSETQLREVPVANVGQALQGRMAGVNVQQTSSQPGGSSQIRIRGTRSLTASNDPLIIVDGIPFGGKLNDIAPDDIKSVDVLKDASATAIYGSRGANGVIMITTNRGGYSKPQTSYSGYAGVGVIAKKYEVFNAEEFVRYREASGYQSGDPYLDQEKQYFETGKSYDWQDEMYKNALITNHDLTFSGGNETVQGSMGLGYFDQSSVLPGQGYTRYSLRTSVDFNMNKWLKVGVNSINSFGLTDGESAGFLYNAMTFSPLVNPYDENGEVIVQPLAPREDAYSPLLVRDNSLWTQERKRYSTINSMYAEIKFTSALKYRVNVGLNYSSDKFGEFYSSKSPFKNGGESTASVSHATSYSYAIENLLFYDKTFRGKHKVGATLLYSVEDSYYEYSSVSGTDMTADFMQYHNLGMANNGLNVNSDNQIYSRRSLLSVMARANYSYDSKYMLTVTARTDGSSVLAPGEKWHSYPSVSAAWNMRRESFMADVNWMDVLKLRAGYGQTSNQSVNPYATMGSLAQNKYNFGDELVFGYYTNTLVNSILGWEYTDSYNAGLDFGLFNGRLTGTFDVYMQKTKNLLVNQSLPASSGVPGSILVNVGKTENKGFEISLHSENIIPKTKNDFGWSTDFNLSRNRNKLVALNSGVDRSVGDGWFVGHPIDVVFDFKKVGIWQINEAEEAARFGAQPGDIKIADLNNDGRITDADRSVIHEMQPQVEMGMTNRMSYKNFDFTVVAFAQVGGTLVSTLHQTQSYLNTMEGRRNNLKVDYWTPTHPTNDHPRPRTGGTGVYGSTLGYFDASYLKIQTMTLGYNVPESFTNKLGVNNLRAFVTCNNVATLFSPYMKKGGVDPQPTGYGSQGVAGVGNPPQGRQLSIGLSTPPARQFLFGLTFKL